jgi:filamentous hemagglutinin family protein
MNYGCNITTMKTSTLLLTPLALTSVLLAANIAQAQTYTPSNRIPVADNTQIGTQVSGSNNNFSINGGLIRGQNLFHSFTDFSVPTGGAATFINPVGNRSIITRVTGNLFSDINGLVNTQGANFFLINPNGMVFGPNAQLNVGKAFVGSTANGIDLVDGSGRTVTFGTNPNGDAPLLSIDRNVFFNVSRLNMGEGTGAISNFGTLQTANPNQYIGLIGGNISMNGGQINAPGGRVEIGGLSAVGTVALGVDGNNLRAQFPTNVARGDVSLTNGARVNVAGAGGGDIAISARNLEILGGSVVRGGIETELGTPEAVAGDIKLNATGDIVVVGSNSGIGNSVRLNSKGNGGNITIDTGSLSLRDGAILRASIYGQGNVGNVTVKAKENVSLSGNAYLLNTVESGGMGKGGNIEIEAGSLSLKDAGQLGTFTRGASTLQPAGQGDAGNITVRVTGAIDIAGTKDGFASGILSYVDPKTVGNGGNITIDAGSFSLRDGARISASTYGKGDAGKITIDAKENLLLDNRSSIFSSIFPEGNSQGIKISAKYLSLSNLSGILTENLGGIGNAGNIDIKTTGDLNITGYTDRSISEGEKINYASLISSSTQGKGDAGRITIEAQGNLSLNNKGAISSVISKQAEGNSQGITISAKDLNLLNSSSIATSNIGGKGNAGNIDLKTTGDLNIVGYDRSIPAVEQINYISFITSGTYGKGDTGKITIDVTGNLLLDDRASISSNISPQAEGNSKGITISAKNLSLLNNSDIGTLNFGGKGNAGDINIKTTGDLTIAGYTDRSISLSDRDNYRSSISSNTSGKGDAGKINVDAQGNISLNNNAFISSLIFPQAEGNSTGISLSSKKLSLSNNSIISTLNGGGRGNAGNIDIKTTGDIELISFTDLSLPQTEKDRSLATISSSTSGKGNTGEITIDAQGNLSLDNTGTIYSNINTQGEGNSQGISINAKNVRLTNTSQISTSNLDGKGNAGNIKIQTKENVDLTNSSSISSASTGEGEAANISISSQKLNLNKSLIFTSGFSVGGGDVTLNLSDLLLLRNTSFIITTSDSTGKNGNGGNITINSPLIVATPGNNDISANAYAGNGGKVTIDSQGLFGIKYRPKGQDSLFTNDITSSSTFGQDGTVNIDTPGTDPGKDKGELAEAPNDASNQISQACGASQRDNKFYITGRGGLPPNAREPQESDALWEDPRAATQQVVSNVSSQTTRKLAPPAVGWVFDGKGKVMLIAAETEGVPTGSRVVCPNEGN